VPSQGGGHFVGMFFPASGAAFDIGEEECVQAEDATCQPLLDDERHRRIW
jgi:hypothetical protein